MRFASVTGAIVQRGPAGLHLVVTLDTGTAVETVRSEWVAALPVPDGEDAVAWQADQYTQETIANELALRGWEPVGLATEPDQSGGTSPGHSSPTYIVRLL